MKFTFGICTTSGNEGRIINIIESIGKNKIPLDCYEIIVVGNISLPHMRAIDIKIIPFDESVKKGWITKKKNIITNAAKYENIVYMHDYIVLTEGWYKSMCNYEDKWDLLMSRIINYDGSRFRDWALCGAWTHNPFVEPNTINSLIPYDEKRLSRWMYFSGTYWVAKKNFMLENPLKESLGWGEGEDVEWSERVRKKTNFMLNPSAVVKVNKPNKEVILKQAKKEFLEKVYHSPNTLEGKMKEAFIKEDWKDWFGVGK